MSLRVYFLSLQLLLFFLQLPAQDDKFLPSAPIKNFRFPHFGDNGYTQWVLKGEEGIYDESNKIHVKKMGLRIYTGDKNMDLDLSLDSPFAVLRLDENKAQSEESITIIGGNFHITGNGWTWDGTTKEISVLMNTRVEFKETFAESITGNTIENKDEKKTVITSQRLNLRTSEDFHNFNFLEDVKIDSSAMLLTADALQAIAAIPSNLPSSISSPVNVKINSLREIRARGGVFIEHSDRKIRADAADFFPFKQLAHFGGKPEIELKGAYLSGDAIRAQSGAIELLGSNENGRAQMLLYETGGLGLDVGTSISTDTIVLAYKILILEDQNKNLFEFTDNAEVLSGDLQMDAKKITVSAYKGNTPKDFIDQPIQVNKVENIIAEGNVCIIRDGQQATCQNALIYPLKGRAELFGNPHISFGESSVSGYRMELLKNESNVYGNSVDNVNVFVKLPAMQELGKIEIDPSTNAIDVPKVMTEETIVKCMQLHILDQLDHTLFVCKDAVKVTGTNLIADCERLEVTAVSDNITNSKSEPMTNMKIVKIKADEHVKIQQEDRIATANTALIFPNDGRIELEGTASVTDPSGTAKGHRIIINQGESRAQVESGNGQRAKVILPELDN
ncbi:MAG: LptA/OstA family protein [Verrucomicrobiota bacterium]|nr:LptA/OstA family protein [Verrucomicrobiota bacterium]